MNNAVQTEGAVRPALTGVVGPLRGVLARAGAVARDRAVFESAALLLPVFLIAAPATRGWALWGVAAAYLGVNVALVWRSSPRGAVRARGMRWNVARIALSVALVAVSQLLTSSTGLLAALYLPIVALAAFGGPVLLGFAVVASMGAHFGVETIDRASFGDAAQRALGLASVILLVAIATRREVRRMEVARRRMRRAVTVDRRRARQLAGVEAIGHILASRGPTPEALDELVGRISHEFGYPYVSIYLGDDQRVTLGARRGHARPGATFDAAQGVSGRVMRTHRPALVPDVSVDPDYIAINPEVVSEVCVPLMADGEFMGFLNVESKQARPLDSIDLRLMVAVADRLAAALIIGRDGQQLAQRVELFRHLNQFSEAVNATLQPDELYASIVRSVSGVVRAEVTTLHVLDRETGRYMLRATDGADRSAVPEEAKPGEGMAGRALRDRTMIIDESAPRPRSAHLGAGFLPDAREGAPMRAAALPLIRDGAVVGVLTLMRSDRSDRFSEPELDALRMLGEQAVLAVSNTFLHAELRELAMRDPLTGLFNRRYLDPALDQLIAQRARVPVAERFPLAAIMFDLDHFSELNNRHGHHVGDEVLRTFGSILRARMRASDLVARWGGEEFAAILFRSTLEDAMRVADGVRQQLADTKISGADGEPVTATVSAGCAAIGPDTETAEELLRAADVALYMAKRAGRDRVAAA
ncbi:MAG: sensor domain-containing diguanylate cyclase [Chloroflexota bacterium]